MPTVTAILTNLGEELGFDIETCTIYVVTAQIYLNKTSMIF